MVQRSAPRMSAGPPALNSQPPQRVGLMVEPTPFTHVSGYANRFNEMLRYMRKAGDEVEVVTPGEHLTAAPRPHGAMALRGTLKPAHLSSPDLPPTPHRPMPPPPPPPRPRRGCRRV